MNKYAHVAGSLLLLLALLISACTANPAVSPTPTVEPTAVGDPPSPPPPSPTAEPRFAAETYVAGVDVSGMTMEEAAAELGTAMASLERPLEIRAGELRFNLRPEQIDLALPVDTLLAEAMANGGRIPLTIDYDAAALQATLEELAVEAAQPAQTGIITASERISRTFVYTPGQVLDVGTAMETIERRLTAPGSSRRVTLSMLADETPPPADFAAMAEQLDDMIPRWDSIVGFYLEDLASGETLTHNEKVVFSGASVMKVAIMLYAYTQVEVFDENAREWLQLMIVDSDNKAANAMLAIAAAGGGGTDEALIGVRAMNEMLKELGLEHSYQNMPYEASDYLLRVRNLDIPRGPAQEGPPPFTEADPVLRTTPADMSRLFKLIDQCSQGEGELLALYATLSADRCREMLDLLADNADTTRMVAGMDERARVEHKSGWLEDMHADVGIVRSPGGDFILAIYVYQQQRNSWLTDAEAAPVIAAFARMVYTAYNPMRME
jgi:beta-lactamase class A